MSRVALLIGVSQYPPGLNPLPRAQKDAVVMQRVLMQPQMQFASVECCCDRPAQELQETIELFFRNRAADDQIVFLLAGYALWDGDDGLYFATPNTKFDGRSAVIRAQTITADFLRDAMNESPARQQVVILDTVVRSVGAPSSPIDRALDWFTHLGGDGRVILAAAATPEPMSEPPDLDVWSYSRYLADGIETGAADTDHDGNVSAAEGHNYVVKKLQIAAPGAQPQRYGSDKTAHCPLFAGPIQDASVSYRKMLETDLPTPATDANAPLIGQPLLSDVQRSLGLSRQTAIAIEAQAQRPWQDYQQRLQAYQEAFWQLTQSRDGADPEVQQQLQQLQQTLYLKDHQVAPINTTPARLAQRRQREEYQRHLDQYEQVLLGAMQRQYPLEESDHAGLHHLQHTLQLKDGDVQALTADLAAQIAPSAESAPPPIADDRTAAPEPPVSDAHAADPDPIVDAASRNPPLLVSAAETVNPPPPAANMGAVPTDDSRAKEAILQQLLGLADPAAAARPPAAPAARAAAPASVPPTPAPTTSTPIASNKFAAAFPWLGFLTKQAGQPLMSNRFRESASKYQALIIPLVLLAAIVGLLVALLPSQNRSSWFKFGQAKTDPVAAQQLISEGLRQSQQGANQQAVDSYSKAIEQNPNNPFAYINRGVAYHKLGNTGAALQDYNRAIELDPKLALAFSNRSHVYYDRQDYDKALADANAAVALNPKLAEAYVNLANARAAQGDVNGAIQDYNRAILLRPNARVQAGAFNNRGNAYLAQSKSREALNDYNQAIRFQHDYADAYYNRGLVQQNLNRMAAIADLQKAADLYQKQGKDQLRQDALNRATALQQSNAQSVSQSS